MAKAESISKCSWAKALNYYCYSDMMAKAHLAWVLLKSYYGNIFAKKMKPKRAIKKATNNVEMIAAETMINDFLPFNCQAIK